jgi:hypothetical protein
MMNRRNEDGKEKKKRKKKNGKEIDPLSLSLSLPLPLSPSLSLSLFSDSSWAVCVPDSEFYFGVREDLAMLMFYASCTTKSLGGGVEVP